MRKLLVFFILLTLLSVGLAQAEGQNESLTTQLINATPAIIVIVAFVLILLWLGGVIKRPRIVGLPLGAIVLLILIILLFVVPAKIDIPTPLPVKDEYKIYPLPEVVKKVLSVVGLPGEICGYAPAIIYYFILPFAGIFAIVWAFLKELNIFTKVSDNVNKVLAFVITFSTIPIGIFVKIAWLIFGLLGIYSVVIFAAIFIVAAFFKGAGVVEKEIAEYKRYIKAIGDAERVLLSELEAILKGNLSDKEKIERIHELITNREFRDTSLAKEIEPYVTGKRENPEEDLKAIRKIVDEYKKSK